MSRRGSVVRSGSGWQIVLDVPDGAGKRRQVRRRGFATKRSAQAALVELLAQVQHGSFVAPRMVTLGQFLNDWLDSLSTSGRRVTTVDSYRRTIRTHVLPTLGAVPLQDVTPLDLDNLYARLASHGHRAGGPLSLRTVRYVHAILGKALGDAERKGLVARNVARRASPPAASATRAPEMAVWTPDQLRAFLDSVAGHHHAALFRLAAMTGLRRAELVGLRWVDVDLDAARIVVRRSITAVNHRPVIGDVKTARSRRTVDLDPVTVGVLREHRSRQLEQRLFVGPAWADARTVFAMGDGRAWHPDVITRAFDRLVRASGLPRIRLHDLRHTHASHLLAAGVNVKVVSERLGHASVAFTLDTYAHVMPGQQASAAAAAAALVDLP